MTVAAVESFVIVAAESFVTVAAVESFATFAVVESFATFVAGAELLVIEQAGAAEQLKLAAWAVAQGPSSPQVRAARD